MVIPRSARSLALGAAIAVLTLASACTRPDPAVPGPASRDHATPARADLPAHLEEDLPHGSISISRTWEGPGAREALHVAEAAYPDPDSILAAIGRGDVARADEATTAEMVREYGVTGPRWWLQYRGEVLVPYAVTGAAVAHALDRARAIRARMAEEGPHTTTVLDSDRNPETLTVVPRVRLVYEAHARTEPRVEVGGEEIRDVAVVEMRLHFSNYCGLLCEFGFYAERTVYVSSDGRVLRIEGDGPPFLTVA